MPIVEPGTGIVLVSRRERRIAQIEQWLGQGLTPRQLSTKARECFGIKHTRADAMVALVLKRLRMDADDEPRESKRARIVSQLQEATRLAFEGKDLKSAVRALHVLSLVEGVVDRNGIADMRARAIVEQEREAFFAHLRGSLGEAKWAEFAAAVDGARVRSGAAENGPGPGAVDPASEG